VAGSDSRSPGGVHVIADVGSDQPPAGVTKTSQRTCLVPYAILWLHRVEKPQFDDELFQYLGWQLLESEIADPT
jgi:hypothetical protein